MWQCRPSTLLTFLLLLFNSISRAQSPATTSDMLASFTINRAVNEVNLVFSVRDSHGHLRTDLTQSDFELRDNNRPPEGVRYFQRQTELPMRVALLIDSSSSIKERIDFEKKAASVFLQRILRKGIDEALVIAFDDQVRLLHDFSTDAGALQSSIGGLQPHGDTALYDAVTFACDKLAHIADTRVFRRVIILISDGEDTRSRKLLSDAQQGTIAVDAVVFSLNTNDPAWGYTKGEAVLDLLSNASGGSILPARDVSDLRRAFSEVEKTLRTQYAVGYTPADFRPDGRFHSVQILPRKLHLSVHCRRGYYAAKR
jgi:Ca-activated chloride channel homolog